LYNAVGGEVVTMPTHLSFEDVKSCDSKLWDILKSSDVGAWRTSVPVSVKQQAVRLFCMTQRAAEEKELLISEMKSTLHFFSNEHSGLLNKVLDNVKGDMPVIIKEGLYVEMKFNSLLKAFQSYLPDLTLTLLSDFAQKVGLTSVQEARISEINDGNLPEYELEPSEPTDVILSDEDFTDSDSDNDSDGDN
jgi:hypothetical protein